MIIRKSERPPPPDFVQSRVQGGERRAALVVVEGRRKLNLTLVTDAGHTRSRNDRAPRDARFSRLRANGIGIVVVATRADEVEQMLVDVTELVGRVIGPALHLVPNDLVSEDESVPVRQCERDAPRKTEQ